MSISSLAILFLLGSLKRLAKFVVIPPQLVAVAWGVGLAQLLGLSPGFRISLPSEVFQGFHLPDFGALAIRRDLWHAVAMGVVTLTLIDAVESLATAMAIDRIDPFRRKSKPNRLLFAMGVSNVASSLVGGLTIIPGGVKSKANIAAGGRTLWANFTNAICLILYLVVARDAINLIPKGALAAVLIYTGYKMCEPLVWRHMAHIGREQLAIFTVTVFATLCTDLLWGIVAGVLAKFVLNMVLYRRAMSTQGTAGGAASLLQVASSFFRNPVTHREMRGDECHLYVERPLVCFNSTKLTSELDHIPATARSAVVHLAPSAGLIDHTSCENLMAIVEELSSVDRPVTVVGLDEMKPLSAGGKGTRVSAGPGTPA